MIEALVVYFEERGFEVSVFPGVLRVRKRYSATLYCNFHWAISQLEIKYGRYEYLLVQADEWIARVDKEMRVRREQDVAERSTHA